MSYILNYTSSTFYFFFNATATTEIYTLSLHDALPIFFSEIVMVWPGRTSNDGMSTRLPLTRTCPCATSCRADQMVGARSEEHTSELQSLAYLVCRLLLEKKKYKRQ